MSAAEERRQRILRNAELRLAKLQDANKSETAPPMAPVSTPAPVHLIKKPVEESHPPQTIQTNQPPSTSSLFSTITSAKTMLDSFTSSSKTKVTPEITKETIEIDQQHILVLILGIFVGLLYSFYISSQSNFFFLIYFTCTICILTSRYYVMKMKHRTNVLITTAMLSGFKPELMKKLILGYTLLCDAWVIFAVYFVSFCLTRVICSPF